MPARIADGKGIAEGVRWRRRNDLAARESGVFVVGFGGVTRCEILVEGADVFVAGPELTAVLDTLLVTSEC
jgi:hypothetical protein